VCGIASGRGGEAQDALFGSYQKEEKKVLFGWGIFFPADDILSYRIMSRCRKMARIAGFNRVLLLL